MKRISLLNRIALLAWAVVMLTIFIRVGITPHRNTVFTTYEMAGKRWLAGESLYTNYRGFVYSPLAAALFAPFSLAPDLASNILWRLLNVFVYAAGVWSLLKLRLYSAIPVTRYGLVFLLLLPLSIGNFNNGQVNPMMIGLLMLAIAAVKKEQWTQAAFCIALATYFKIYPLAEGLLLILLFPRKFTPRLVIALILLGALSFALQRPAYVLEQTHKWIATRMDDHRHTYKAAIAPSDLWLVLKVLHIPMSEKIYKALQFLAAFSIAVVCVFGRWKQWPVNRLLIALFSLLCCWMLLLGPATESATYILLAPAFILALVDTFGRPTGLWLRLPLLAAGAAFLTGLAINSFTHLHGDNRFMIIQPIAALAFSCYLLIWLRTITVGESQTSN